MEKEKVTKDVLRDMAVGETRVFALPRHEPYRSRAANSGKAIAYAAQRELGCSFTASTDFDNATLTLTKNPRT